MGQRVIRAADGGAARPRRVRLPGRGTRARLAPPERAKASRLAECGLRAPRGVANCTRLQRKRVRGLRNAAGTAPAVGRREVSLTVLTLLACLVLFASIPGALRRPVPARAFIRGQ